MAFSEIFYPLAQFDDILVLSPSTPPGRPPSLADGELKAGMVVTVEPGLYYPDWGGFRWEYMALITEDGCEII